MMKRISALILTAGLLVACGPPSFGRVGDQGRETGPNLDVPAEASPGRGDDAPAESSPSP